MMPAPASREWALGLWDHGYQVVVAPLRAKRPHVPWKAFQTHRVPREAVEEWFAHGEHNIAILTGAMGGVTKRTPKRTPPALPSPRRCPNPKGEALRCPLPLVHRPQIRYTLHQLLQIPLEPHRAPLLAPQHPTQIPPRHHQVRCQLPDVRTRLDDVLKNIPHAKSIHLHKCTVNPARELFCSSPLAWVCNCPHTVNRR